MSTATTTQPILTLEQVTRILRSRIIIDHSMAGGQLSKNLRIVGQGNKTKDVDNQRMVYNTNAMRRDAMAQAKAFVFDAHTALSIGDNEGAQEAFRKALNVGVLSFSHPVEGWEPFPANALITAVVSSFTIKSGADAGKTGIGLDQVRLAPSIEATKAGAEWDALLGDLSAADAASSVPFNAANVIA